MPAKLTLFDDLLEVSRQELEKMEKENPKKVEKRGARKPCWSKPQLPLVPDSNSSSSWIKAHRQMGGGDIVFVLERKLTMSDVKPRQSRVFLNREEMNAVLIPAMMEREVSLVKDLKKGLPVVAIDQAGRRYGVVIKWWPSLRQYVLIKKWLDIVKKNGLKEGDWIRMWLFRRVDNKELCLIIKAV